MRFLLLIIFTTAINLISTPICWADDSLLDNTESPSQVHGRIVSQELDNIESSGIKPVDSTSSVSSTSSASSISPTSSIPSVSSTSTTSHASLSPHIVAQRNEFAVSNESYWTKYDEPKNLTKNGFMTGYSAQFYHRTLPDQYSRVYMLGLQGQWAKGKVNTSPSDQCPSGIKDNTFDLRAIVGADFYPYSFLRATPYLGFGYRYLNDNSQGLTTTTDNNIFIGYDQFAHYLYLPIGADIVYEKSPHYSLETTLEDDPLLRGWQVDKLGVVPGYSTLVFHQKFGNGIRASLRLNLYFKYCTAFAEGFYRYWYLDNSKNLADPTDPSVSLNGPRNNTQEFGFRLGLQV